VVRATLWKCRTQKITKNCHLGTNGQVCRVIPSQLRHVSTVGKINLLSSNFNTSPTCSHNMVNFGPCTCGCDWFVSLRHHYEFQLVSRLGSVTAWYSSSERQPNFAALNRGRHLYSAGRPSRWALALILVFFALEL